MSTLFDQVGGEEKLRRILEDLYQRLFDDPMVGFLFAGHDRERIVAMQLAFTRRMLGDTSACYTGKSIPEAHASLPILPGHFDRRHKLLADVLQEHGVPEEVQQAWLQLDQGFRTSLLKTGQRRIDELKEDNGDHADPRD
ncbi:MAG: group 1 truncated hemoglobin [Myxococcales bacterium]|nr:group 1 truncated hemoglobin [Polyangiaceae bacterium]MDW8249894.1 group 1 truncated hemoglobin [Myxococcales bacterium]